MIVNCDELTQLLPDLVDGTLTPELQAAVEAALPDCPDCQRDLEIARQVRVLLTTLQSERPELHLPADFELRLLARVRNQQANVDILDLSSLAFGTWLVEFINMLGGLIAPASPGLTNPARPLASN
jgi:anti-sigma factor RsiW